MKLTGDVTFVLKVGQISNQSNKSNQIPVHLGSANFDLKLKKYKSFFPIWGRGGIVVRALACYVRGPGFICC